MPNCLKRTERRWKMPQAFNECIKNGGRVRTKKLKGGKYIKICYLNGKSYAGEVHEKKTNGKK